MNQRDLFAALEATCDEDILRVFPSRYESLVPTPIPENPEDGVRLVVKGTVVQLKSFSSRGTSLIRFRLNSMTGHQLPCMLYNQPYYISKLSSGKDLCMVLYYSEARKVYMVQSIQDLDSYFVMTGLRPVYSLPKAVSPSYFASYVKKVLSYPREASYMSSRVPPKYVEKYRLMNEFDAYRMIHLPKNEKDLSLGQRVFKYEEALSYCIRSLSIRRSADQRKKSYKTEIDHKKINQFVASLSYKLTQDQIVAIREIITDMENSRIMYRLLQGDVGTGKTIVAFVSLYANYLRHKQGVLMAPTFELATQHYKNALKVFDNYGIKVSLLAGTPKSRERAKIQEGLKSGEIDILIATHAALSDSIGFSSLGLSIIDEQQLFGVEQRETLMRKGEANDILMMSATPIPRTLSQIINSDLDVSTLSQFPHGLRNVRTQVVTSQDPLIMKAIEKALSVHRQVFIVAPKIEDGTTSTNSAESIYKDIRERFSDDKVQLLHGKIKKDERDAIISDFASGFRPILVSTTVIEVGIDVSTACLLIVYDANCFGLSTLHQLRGRIGRSGDFALALLVYDGNDKDAKEKVEFLASTEDGLKISQFDLKQRGSGSYSGVNQSGKSELKICNFVDDLKMFEYAKQDAAEILDHPEDEDNSKYLKSIDSEQKTMIV